MKLNGPFSFVSGKVKSGDKRIIAIVMNHDNSPASRKVAKKITATWDGKKIGKCGYVVLNCGKEMK